MSESKEYSEITLTLNQVHEKLEDERAKDRSPAPWATEENYTNLQGGVPLVLQGKPLTIIHDYVPDSPKVRSSKTLQEFGVLKIKTDDGVVKSFAIALLWSSHGGPCEAQSRKIGGQGYPRKK